MIRVYLPILIVTVANQRVDGKVIFGTVLRKSKKETLNLVLTSHPTIILEIIVRLANVVTDVFVAKVVIPPDRDLLKLDF